MFFSCQAKIATLEVRTEGRKSHFCRIILGMVGVHSLWLESGLWGSPGAGTGAAQVAVKD